MYLAPVWILAMSVAASGAPGIILDTDFRSDVDDVGALAMLNALADNGECELLGVIASQTGPHIVAAINAVNTWYGRVDVPVGLSPVDDQRFPDHYAPVIGDPERFPSTQRNETAPDSTALYRRLLHAAADQSVKIVVIGGQTCVRLLLDSEADYEGDGSIGRTGRELAASKVIGLYLMAGNFANGEHREHNVNLDLEAAQRVAAEWPTYIVYSGFEVGRPIQTGGRMTDPERNPVAKAYKLFPAGGVGVIAPSASFDQTMVYHAVRGAAAASGPLWEVRGPGTATFPEGRTEFTPAPDGGRGFGCAAGPGAKSGAAHWHLALIVAPETAAEAIEDLMIQAPRH